MKRALAIAVSLMLLLAGCAAGDKKDHSAGNSGSASTESSVSASVKSESASGDRKDVQEEAGNKEGASGTDETVDTDNAAGAEKTDDTGAVAAPELLYQGHASLRIVTPDDRVIYIDPFAGEGYDLPADLVLVTHAHYDHNGLDKISSRADDCMVVTQKEALEGGTHQTFTFGDIVIEAVEAGYNANHNASECVGYILTFANDVQLYVSGDTSTTPQMETLAARDIDYAFFSCDGVYNMNAEEASACAETVGAAHSIPYHVTAADKGLFDRAAAEAFQAKGRLILEPGETLLLEP